MPTSISTIKDKLDEHLGQSITVVAQAGRKKVTRRHGVLKRTFPAVFVVDLDQDQNNFEHVSYSYTDLLTKNIALEFND
ncbi:MAG: Veg family protein [Lactobacillus sp.]|nr:Veg family protein [Lactobacillus sp.]MDN6043364.1 Veg family protein [Lactobacillus sp.]MDN6052984.1 Veg family protein [Lactobacillus sp.]